MPAGIAAPAAPAVLPAVGATPALASAGGIFPDTFNDLGSLTHLDILVLVQFYNDTMGIMPGDTLPVRRNKLREFITYGF